MLCWTFHFLITNTLCCPVWRSFYKQLLSQQLVFWFGIDWIVDAPMNRLAVWRLQAAVEWLLYFLLFSSASSTNLWLLTCGNLRCLNCKLTILKPIKCPMTASVATLTRWRLAARDERLVSFPSVTLRSSRRRGLDERPCRTPARRPPRSCADWRSAACSVRTNVDE